MTSLRGIKWWAAGLVLLVPIVVYAQSNPFAPGSVLTAQALNEKFAALEARIAELETGAVVATPSQLDPNDPPDASWQFFAQRCFDAMTEAVQPGTPNGTEFIPFACTLAARRKCRGLGHTTGFFVGEGNAEIPGTRSIECIQ